MKKKAIFLFTAGILVASVSLQTANAQVWNLNGNAEATTNAKLGTTGNVPLKFYTNNIQRMVIDSLGKVGIGTADALGLLTIKATGGTPAASWLTNAGAPEILAFGEEKSTGFNLATAANYYSASPVIATRRSRGTLAFPKVINNNDILGSFVSSGYDGSFFQSAAAVNFMVDNEPSLYNVPTGISFVTGTNLLTRKERLKIGSNGNILFNDNQVTITKSSGDVRIGTGNLFMSSAAKTIQFAAPVTGSASMMTMFPASRGSLTIHPDRMVIAHSAAFKRSGLQYQDSSSRFNFLSDSLPVLTVDLGARRVGVGTSRPLARLQVVGNSIAEPVISATTSYVGPSNIKAIESSAVPADGYGSGIFAIGGNKGGHFLALGGAYTGSIYGVYSAAIGTAGTHYGVFGSASGGNENWGGYFPTKTYTSELRVGGTKGATGYAASINGKLIAEEVRVELKGNWPDYVFKKDYKLMPIDTLEAIITLQKHLPGIPAAGQIKEHGIMLGEMQTKTMEKVEETTLYIIQLNNKLKLLEKKIEELTTPGK